MEFLKDLYKYLMERKTWWLVPAIVVLLLVGVLLLLAQNAAVAPFVYTLF